MNNSINVVNESNNNNQMQNENEKSPSWIGNEEWVAEESPNTMEPNEQSMKKMDTGANKHSSIITFSNINFNSSLGDAINSAHWGNRLLLSGELFYNKEFIIDKNGLANGLRGKHDSQTYFGISNNKDYTGTFFNDIILNYNPANSQGEQVNRNISTNTGRLFDISYQCSTNDYQWYMIHNSWMLNYEINQYVYFDLDKDYYLIWGEIFLTISVKKSDGVRFIDIQVEMENEEFSNFSFTQEEVPITLGRVNSKIEIKNNCISKSHALVDFSQEMCKFYYRDLNSTNGSIWIIKENDYIKLKGDMKFKWEDIKFRILELP